MYLPGSVELPAVELSDIATGASDSTTTATIHLRSMIPRPLSRPSPVGRLGACCELVSQREEPGVTAGLFS